MGQTTPMSVSWGLISSLLATWRNNVTCFISGRFIREGLFFPMQILLSIFTRIRPITKLSCNLRPLPAMKSCPRNESEMKTVLISILVGALVAGACWLHSPGLVISVSAVEVLPRIGDTNHRVRCEITNESGAQIRLVGSNEC